MGSTTSRSSRRAARATPTMSTSRGTSGPYRFDLPLLAAALDGVVSPETAGLIGKLGGLAVLNLEGIYCRYEDADAQLERIATFSRDIATREMQDMYREPVKPELIARRIDEIKATAWSWRRR